MSQVSRVLALLRSRPEGLNTSQLQEAPVLDGGPPVLRLAARIRQLREAGYTISSRREANQTATYTLVSEPDGPMVSAAGGIGGVPESERVTSPRTLGTTPVAEPQGLFDPVGFTERGDFRDVAA